jgi:hypothetical protein
MKRKSPGRSRVQSLINRTKFQIEGVLVVNGMEGKAIVSHDPDQPLVTTGKQLSDLGLNVLELVKGEYLIPLTNQSEIERLIQ